jgi:hypothetical protein
MKPKDRLVMIHVSPEDDITMKLMGANATSVKAEMELTPILKKAMVDYKLVIVSKDSTKTVAQQILNTAYEQGANFLMLASKYQEEARMGSVTDSVIKNAKCTCVACKV